MNINFTIWTEWRTQNKELKVAHTMLPIKIKGHKSWLKKWLKAKKVKMILRRISKPYNQIKKEVLLKQILIKA
jgi:hypothetical protein